MQNHFNMDSVAIRSAVLANAEASLGAIDGVEAIYLSGSLAEGTDDHYSDIDLRVVAADMAYESVVALREPLPRTWGPFVFHETVNPNLTVSYYESLTKADVFYYRSSAVLPSPWFNRGTRILLDRTGRLANVVEASKLLRFTSPSAAILNHIEKCLAGLIEGAKRTLRNEPIYASRLCGEALHHLLVADDLLCGRAPFGSSKRERLAPGPLANLARSALRIPTIEASDSYFAQLATPLRALVCEAEQKGHCSQAMTVRLLAAIEQMILLTGGRGFSTADP